MSIEKAAWEASNFPSRAILWHTLGCGIDPEFALNMQRQARSLEVWRGAYHSTRQWKEAAKGLEWQTKAQPNIVITQTGCSTFDGWRFSNKGCCPKSLKQKLWKIETRCPDFDPELPQVPIMNVHMNVAMNILQTCQKQVALTVARGFVTPPCEKAAGRSKTRRKMEQARQPGLRVHMWSTAGKRVLLQQELDSDNHSHNRKKSVHAEPCTVQSFRNQF